MKNSQKRCAEFFVETRVDNRVRRRVAHGQNVDKDEYQRGAYMDWNTVWFEAGSAVLKRNKNHKKREPRKDKDPNDYC